MSEVNEALKHLAKVLKVNHKYLSDNGMYIKGLNLSYRDTYDNMVSEMHVEFHDRGGDDKHPGLKEFDERTTQIKEQMDEAKQEIRARIYGMDTTYEDIDKDLNQYIEGIKF